VVNPKRHTTGDGPQGAVTFLLFCARIVSAILLISAPARGALRPPSALSVRDTLASGVERGFELTRLDQQFATHAKWGARLSALAHGHWRTDRRTPEQETDRIRQDGRWYAASEHFTHQRARIWVAAEGEHFDDRPVASAPARFRLRELQPNSPLLPEVEAALFSGAINSVRILRGGGGVSVLPVPMLHVNAGVGLVEDKRLGRRERGLGAWTSAQLEPWNAGGYLHSGELEYNRETPANHQNLDLSGHYQIFREFYPGNSNRADVNAAVIQRDIYLDQSGTLSKREDRRLRVVDVLDYRVSSRANVQLSGDVLHDVTEQSQVDEARSRLEENQAGFQLNGVVARGRWNTQGQLGLRLITQTIRADVLQGSKADMAMAAGGPLGTLADAALRLSVSKYRLDTRNEQNFDDRDELRYALESALTRRINASVRAEVDLSGRLDHLVYIFRQKSANNRWTRYVGLGARILHQPSPRVQHTVRTLISSNFTDYDFEDEARLTRSNIFRRILAMDSINWNVGAAWTVRTRAQGQIEEFGRLFWERFEEERSDETRSANLALEVARGIGKGIWLGGGALWDSRHSVRFPTTTNSAREVAQDYRAYGPTWFVERKPGRGLFLRIFARHLRQFRLDKEDRWLFTGEGVLAWKF
jgi:hypothetical protein